MDQDLVSIRYTREKSTYTFLFTPRTYESGLDHLHIRFSHFPAKTGGHRPHQRHFAGVIIHRRTDLQPPSPGAR